MAKQNHKTITGNVDRVVFHDQDSGRVILSIVREDGKSARIIGNVVRVEKGDTITAEGFWQKDEKYGWQFMSETINSSSCPTTDDDMMNALDFSNVNQPCLKGFRGTKGICNYSEYPAEDTVFPTIDGVVYNKDRTFLISASEDITTIVIPESVTRIGAGAFRGCNCLTSVTIGESVSSIGKQAFADCLSLKSVHISDVSAWCGVKFGDAESNPISIADTLIINGEECKNLVIPDSVKSISDYAFYGCSSLTSVSLPKGLEKIGIKAFVNCYNLEDLIVPSSVTYIYSDALRGCKNFRIDREFDVPWNCLKFSGNSISAEIKFSDYPENNMRRYIKPDLRYDYIFTLNADFDGVDDRMNKFKDIIGKTVPKLKIRMLSKDKGEIINADRLNEVVLQLKKELLAEETSYDCPQRF